MKKITLHAGIHKTGTTSIQAFLDQNREKLRRLGADFYSGHYIASNHVELHVATMRPERMSPFKMDRNLSVDADYVRGVEQTVKTYVKNSPAQHVIFSAEGLSYLRYPDEFDRLKSIFAGHPVRVIVYVRDPEKFLNSYRHEMTKHRLPDPIDRDSFAYTGKDSWLIDFGSRIDAFEHTFGPGSVTVIDYDIEMRIRGNVIPSFLKTLEIENSFHPEDWDALFLNSASEQK